LRIQPGPADAAPTKGDLTDWSHIFGGRARLCVAGPVPREYEGTAWCTWSDRFDFVKDAGLLPLPVDAVSGQIDAGVSFELGRSYLSGTAPTGEISSWEGVLRQPDVRSHDHGRWGIVRFAVQPVPADPEQPPPPIVRADIVGLLRWSCLEPTVP
jgi:hypothetical protein